MQLLEIRIAQHQSILCIPKYERLRDRLDSVTQSQIRFDRFLHKRLLLGDVDRDADQVWASIPGLMHEFATRAQPYPISVRMAHAERVVDQCGFRIDQVPGEFVEVDIVGMDQGIDLAEAQQRVARLLAEDGKHRVRPEYAPARKVPIP